MDSLYTDLDKIIYAKDALEIISNYDFTKHIPQNTVHNEKKGYNKFLFYKSSKYDIYFIYWNAYSETLFHNHSENGCVMKILYGQLVEERLSKKDNIITETIMKPYTVSYIENNYAIHKIKEKTGNPALSVHVYFPGGFKTSYYNVLNSTSSGGGVTITGVTGTNGCCGSVVGSTTSDVGTTSGVVDDST